MSVRIGSTKVSQQVSQQFSQQSLAETRKKESVIFSRSLRRALAAASLAGGIGCSSDPLPRDVTQKPRITDATACARLCDDLVSCGGAPGRCVQRCEEDRARLRKGFEASFVSCVERELVAPACSMSPTVEGDPIARSEKISLCYSATLEVYAREDGGKSMTRVLQALCKRSVRCEQVAPGNEDACVTELAAQAKIGVVSKLLAAARDELVDNIATCVAGRVCGEDDPVAPCLGADAADATGATHQGAVVPNEKGAAP